MHLQEFPQIKFVYKIWINVRSFSKQVFIDLDISLTKTNIIKFEKWKYNLRAKLEENFAQALPHNFRNVSNIKWKKLW